MMGKRKVFKCIYCVRPVTGRHHAIVLKNEYTHDVNAGLSLRWAHMRFFVLLMHSCSILMNHALRKPPQLVSYIVQFFSFLNLIFHGSRHLLRLYNKIFDGPGRKPQSRQVFSIRGDGFENYKVQVCVFFLTFVT